MFILAKSELGRALGRARGSGRQQILQLHGRSASCAPAGGMAMACVEVLERGNPPWGEPTLVLLADGRLLYVADARRDRHGAGGA